MASRQERAPDRRRVRMLGRGNGAAREGQMVRPDVGRHSYVVVETFLRSPCVCLKRPMLPTRGPATGARERWRSSFISTPRKSPRGSSTSASGVVSLLPRLLRPRHSLVGLVRVKLCAAVRSGGMAEEGGEARRAGGRTTQALPGHMHSVRFLTPSPGMRRTFPAQR